MNYLLPIKTITLAISLSVLIWGTAKAQTSGSESNLRAEMKGKAFYGQKTQADIDNHSLLIELEHEDFVNEMKLLDWALVEKSIAVFDSLSKQGHWEFLRRPTGESGKYTSLSYCLCHRHNKENWELATKDVKNNPVFVKLYSGGFFTEEHCKCMGLDYVPSTPIHNASYYMDVINKLFADHGPELKSHSWTLEKFKSTESKKHLTTDYSLAFFRKSFLYHISTSYGIEM